MSLFEGDLLKPSLHWFSLLFDQKVINSTMPVRCLHFKKSRAVVTATATAIRLYHFISPFGSNLTNNRNIINHHTMETSIKEEINYEGEPEAAVDKGSAQGAESPGKKAARRKSIEDGVFYEAGDEGKDFRIPLRLTKSGRKRATPFPIKVCCHRESYGGAERLPSHTIRQRVVDVVGFVSNGCAPFGS